MQRGIFCLALLFVPSMAWSRPYDDRPYAPVESALLRYYKSKLACELRQLGVHWRLDLESRNILELRGELEAWRELTEHPYFESSHISDYIELDGRGYGGREEHPESQKKSPDSLLVCKVSNGFVGCHFRNETDLNDANLFLVTAYVREYLYEHDVYELTGHTRAFYTLRRMSKTPTWKLHICRADAYECSVSIRIVQIASLNTFEAQLSRLAKMIDDIEEETIGLLKPKDQHPKDQDQGTRTKAKKDSIPLRPYEFADFAYKPSSPDEEEGLGKNSQEAQDEPVEEGGYRDEL